MDCVRQVEHGLGRIGDWPLWGRPALSIWYVLAVDLGALAVVANAFAQPGGAAAPSGTAAVILVAAVVQGEASRRIERFRGLLSGSVHINMMSVWVFAAVLTLPMSWVTVVTVLVAAHVMLRSYVRRSHPHRQVMNCAAMVLAAWSARLVLDVGGLHTLTRDTSLTAASIVVVVIAAAMFFAVDGLLIALSLWLDGEDEHKLTDLVGSADDNALELATICLGAIVGLVLAYQPFALVFLFVPLFVLHRSVLVKQLQELATKDQKTGLLNASSWQDVAAKELASAVRSRSTFGVLMVDLDHFKLVNDTHGHLAGDEALKAVASAVRRSVRDYDVVGRFGGEEFVVLLPGLPMRDVLAVAERIRQAISQLRVPLAAKGTVLSTLSASIGAAIYPEAAAGLDELVHAADTALYRAKSGGRNRVVSIFDPATPERARN